MNQVTPTAIADRIEALLKRFGRSKAEALRVTGIADHILKNLRKDRWPQLNGLIETADRLQVDLFELFEPLTDRKGESAKSIDPAKLRTALRIARELIRRSGVENEAAAEMMESIATAEIYRHYSSLTNSGRSEEDIERELSLVAETAVRISSEFIDN